MVSTLLGPFKSKSLAGMALLFLGSRGIAMTQAFIFFLSFRVKMIQRYRGV